MWVWVVEEFQFIVSTRSGVRKYLIKLIKKYSTFPFSSCPFQVCIVQKRDSGNLFAMKYVSRNACIGRGALGGVLKEVELLASLEHPFLVNLWFSFQGTCRYEGSFN